MTPDNSTLKSLSNSPFPHLFFSYRRLYLCHSDKPWSCFLTPQSVRYVSANWTGWPLRSPSLVGYKGSSTTRTVFREISTDSKSWPLHSKSIPSIRIPLWCIYIANACLIKIAFHLSLSLFQLVERLLRRSCSPSTARRTLNSGRPARSLSKRRWTRWTRKLERYSSSTWKLILRMRWETRVHVNERNRHAYEMFS